MVITLCLVFVLFNVAEAQTKEGIHYYVIPPSEYWHAQSWSKDSVYLFPEFQESKIELSNGYSPSAPLVMNYHLFLEKFFVKSQGQELTPFDFADEIKYIWIGDHKFIHSKQFGYLEVIMEGRASVAQSTFMRVIMEASSMQKYPTSLSDNRMGVANSTRRYYIDRKYYILSDPSHIHRASAAVLPKIFPKEKQTIRDFEKNQKTDYTKKDDILKVVLFCNREL